MRRINIRLDEEQAATLDRLARQRGVSRAELIRELIDRALTGADRDVACDLKAIEDSFGAWRDLEAPVCGRGHREEHLDRL